MTEKLREILREPSSMYLVDASVLVEAADAIAFFRDQLTRLGCPPRSVQRRPCRGVPCPFERDGDVDYAACWDEVERRQR